LERDLGRGVHLLGGELGLAQDQRQRHGEAAGMGRAQQLLGIGALLALEAGGKAIGVGAERAALRRDRALAVPEAARPGGRCAAIDLHGGPSLVGWRSLSLARQRVSQTKVWSACAKPSQDVG